MFRFRSLSEVVLAWLVGAVAALLVFMWPSSDPCPHFQTCAAVPMPWWQRVLGVLVLVGPGLLATALWRRNRKRAPE